MKWYYAHSMLIYNTQRELEELNRLKELVDDVINPRTDVPKGRDMTSYLEAVRNSDGVVCSDFQGHIGKGVFSEVATALGEGKPVYVLRNNKLDPVLGVKIVNPKDWKVAYGKLLA